MATRYQRERQWSPPSVLSQGLRFGHLRRRLHPVRRRQTQQPAAQAVRLSHAARSVRAVVQTRCTSELNPPTISCVRADRRVIDVPVERSEEHTSELQSLMRISYAVFCLKQKKTRNTQTTNYNK